MKRDLPLQENARANVKSGSRWYAVYTQPHKEQQAARHLRNQEFEVFLPLLKKTIRHSRQFREVRRPLFPQYLFVRMDPGRDAWRPINGTFGVVGLVRVGNDPTPLPHGLIEGLADMTDADSNELSFGVQLAPGQTVHVKSGPFANFYGQIEQLDDKGRVLLLLEMMGRGVRVWSPSRDISIAR